MAAVLPSIPQGTLKQLNLADIKWDKRYREDFTGIEDLAESIKDKGLLQPITVSTDMVLLAGERRVRACKLAGLVKIPALVRKVEGEIDAREIELMENIFRKDFTWLEEANLIAEIDRLYKEKHIDWIPAAEGGSVKPGWSSRRTAELLGKSVSSVSRAIRLAQAATVIPELATHKTAADAAKVIEKLEEQTIVHELRQRQLAQVDAASKAGGEGLEKGIAAMLKRADGNYRIGDVFEGLKSLKTDGNIAMIECDPPYGIDLAQMKSSKDNVASNVRSYQEVDQAAYPEFLGKLAKELFRVAAKNAWLVFWFGPTWHQQVLTALREAGWHVDDIPGIWAKRQGQTLQPEIYMARGYEPFFLCRKGQPVMAKRGRLNVFDFPGVPGAKKYHPTERPVELLEELLTMLLPGGISVVLVPFLGSGATIRAAYNLGLYAFGWDMNPEYKDKFMLVVEADARDMTPEGEGSDEQDNADDDC